MAEPHPDGEFDQSRGLGRRRRAGGDLLQGGRAPQQAYVAGRLGRGGQQHRPGEFYLRELPPLRTVLGVLSGLGLLVVDGYADLDPPAGPAWARMPTPSSASR
jgi:hypothetical protein